MRASRGRPLLPGARSSALGDSEGALAGLIATDRRPHGAPSLSRAELCELRPTLTVTATDTAGNAATLSAKVRLKR